MLNKTKYRLYEMFDKTCNTNLLNEAYIDSEGNLRDLYIITDKDMIEIFRGYIESALWTEEERLEDKFNYDDEDSEDMDDFERLIKFKNNYNNSNFNSFASEDIDVNSKIEVYKDIKNFINNAGDVAVNEAIKENGLFRLGMDIWLTRNHHGSGFFDHSYENEKKLTDAGHKLGEINLIIGDDNKLYFE